MIASFRRKPKEPVIRHYAISTKNAMRASSLIALPCSETFFKLTSMKLIVFSKN